MSTNPRITLQMSDADCYNVVKALAAASGKVFTAYEGETLHRKAETNPELRDAISQLRRHHDFDWSNLPFADCVRDLCRVYPVSYWSQGSRSMVIPRPCKEGQPAQGAASPHRWEGDGVVVYAKSLHDSRSRVVNFETGTCSDSFDSFSIFLGCAIPGGEADRIVEMDNFEAQDDLGNLINDKGKLRRLEFSPAHTGPYPDEWYTMFGLGNVSPEAETIARLEADLYEYSEFELGQIVFELPVSRARKKVQLWDVTLELVSFEAGGNVEEDDKENDCGPNRHRLRMILHKPKDIRVSTPGDDSTIMPMLMDASGRTFENAGTEFGGMDFLGHDSLEIEAHFTPRRSSPTQVVLQLARKAHPRKRTRFGLENIPLR